MAFKFARFITLLPNHALQRLEWRGFAILGNPLLQNLDHPLYIGFWLPAAQAYRTQLHGHVRVFGMRTHEFGKVFARIREQHIEYEADRAGRAFDIGQDGFDRHVKSLVFEAREAVGDVLTSKVCHPAVRVIEQANRDEMRVLAHVKPMRCACGH